MARYPLFIVRPGDCWEDGWTYGEWRQYICNRPGGQTQCARVSRLQGLLMIPAMAMIIIPGFFMIVLPPEVVAWGRTIPTITIGAILLLVMFIANRKGYVLMRAVGPPNDGDRRVFPWEDKKA